MAQFPLATSETHERYLSSLAAIPRPPLPPSSSLRAFYRSLSNSIRQPGLIYPTTNTTRETPSMFHCQPAYLDSARTAGALMVDPQSAGPQVKPTPSSYPPVLARITSPSSANKASSTATTPDSPSDLNPPRYISPLSVPLSPTLYTPSSCLDPCEGVDRSPEYYWQSFASMTNDPSEMNTEFGLHEESLSDSFSSATTTSTASSPAYDPTLCYEHEYPLQIPLSLPDADRCHGGFVESRERGDHQPSLSPPLRTDHPPADQHPRPDRH